MSLDKKQILGAVGIVALVGLIVALIKELNSKTETKLYSDEAFKDLQDSKKRKELDGAISNYYKNGKWDKSSL